MTHLEKWQIDDGNNTHNLNYNLNENSIVLDIGGYTGVWAEQMIEKYNPYVYILEPVKEYYNVLKYKFKYNNKVNILNVGVSTENKRDVIYINNDSSSTMVNNGYPITVDFFTLDTILKMWNISHIDLVQINVEGAEYSLLNDFIETNIINSFDNIQIQFHENVEDYYYKRIDIQKKLITNSFKLKYNYPFVWEAWYKII